MEHPTRKLLLLILFPLLLSIALIGTVYLVKQQGLSLPTNNHKPRPEDTVRAVARHMVLPKKEDPVVATVSNRQKLQSQPFFTNAKNGDKVLIYTNSGRAILYRPAIDKLINAGPLNLTPPDQPTTATAAADQTNPASPAPIPAYTLALYNGSDQPGLTHPTGDLITAAVPTTTITAKETAAGTYEKTIVVDLTGHPDLAARLAELLNAEIQNLPDGEAAPNADILVIVGNDRT